MWAYVKGRSWKDERKSILGVLVLRDKRVDVSVGDDSFMQAGGVSLSDIGCIVDISILLAFLYNNILTEKKYFYSLLLLALAPWISLMFREKSIFLLTLEGKYYLDLLPRSP